MALLDVFLGPRLPRDQATRVPFGIRRKAAPHVATLKAKIVQLAALPGIADIAQSKRVPKGFYALVDDILDAYDAYADTVREGMSLSAVPRPGAPEGATACLSSPLGITGIEALAIYREIRTWRDFPQVVTELQRVAEGQLKEIQSRHRGKDPERISLVGRPVREGRLAFARKGVPCPFLDKSTRKCRIWDVRPINCRMHHMVGDLELHNPQHPKHLEAKSKNLRLPVRAQVELGQVDKRTLLQISPFLYVGVLQIAALAEGLPLPEIGELPAKVGADGMVTTKANRDVKHSKRNQKLAAKEAKKASRTRAKPGKAARDSE